MKRNESGRSDNSEAKQKVLSKELEIYVWRPGRTQIRWLQGRVRSRQSVKSYHSTNAARYENQ